MKRDIGFSIYLPPSYADSADRKYAVVYYLHGAGGSESSSKEFAWAVRQAIAEAAIEEVICVFPNGGRYSGYRDWSSENVKSETWIIQELIPYIDQTYRTVAERESRSLCGWSMGGGASLRFLFKYPEMFGAAASMSGSVDYKKGDSDDTVTKHLVANADQIRDRVKIWMAVGEEDFLKPGNEELVEKLNELKIDHQYQVLPKTGHDLGEMLEAFHRQVALAVAAQEPANEAPDQDDGDVGGRKKYDVGAFWSAADDQSGLAVGKSALKMQPGFRAELVYSVPLDEQGSWVALTTDDDGNLIASDQYSGIYRIKLADSSEQPQVERFDLELGGCQGLLVHRGVLYGVVNGDTSGLFKITDSTGNGHYDTVALLRKFEGGNEHGPHGIIPTPDGESLLIVGGNGSTPGHPQQSRVPSSWREDRLLTRSNATDGGWDESNHYYGGWVLKTDLEGKDEELVAMGFRNPYDIALNQLGELFTYDADMEWDTGTPWYRPTRVNHVVSGADFGWRAGSAKWPKEFFDSVGSVVDIGLGSPTGIAFGYGTKFPAKFQNALFIGDWSLGNIYVVHLTPSGASYVGESSPFVVGAPLPVTDMVVRKQDGALYFSVGGRGVSSAIYRVVYEGDESTSPANVAKSNAEAVTRRQLETMHVEGADTDLDLVWESLSSHDRAIRFAARIALEHSTSNVWWERLAAEEDVRTVVAATLAAARSADAQSAEKLISVVKHMIQTADWEDLEAEDRTDFLRVAMVLVSRHGREGELAKQLSAVIENSLTPHFPTGFELHDQMLAEILCVVAGEKVIDSILQKLESADTQEAQIHYAMCLREIGSGWALPQRRRYLSWFQNTANQTGGVLFGDYLGQIHRAVIDQLDENEATKLAEFIEIPQPADPLEELKKRDIVSRWTGDSLLQELSTVSADRDDVRGAKVYREALCINCHRFEGRGGQIGPDLTAVGKRFNVSDVVEAIIHPDKVISDQYRNTKIITIDGKVITGKVKDLKGNHLLIMENDLNQSDLTIVKRDEIEEQVWSETSSMPTGLVDFFTAEEIADLISFVRSAAKTD